MPNKKRKCKQCGDFVLAETGIKVPAGFFCSHDHAIMYAQASQEAARERSRLKQLRQHREERKAHRKALRDFNRKDRAWQHKQTQKAFNRMRMLEEFVWFKARGQEPVCISCGKPNMDWCCGHFKTRGARPDLRYDRKNTYLQCNHRCNSQLSGNIHGDMGTHGYLKGLEMRFGQEEYQRIIDHCDTVQAKKWTWHELEDMRREFNEQIRSLAAKLQHDPRGR